MDPILSHATAGLRSRMVSLDMLANNLSNASTAGYKLDREQYGQYSGAEDEAMEGLMPDIQGQWTDFTQGVLHPSGAPFDLALSGAGFFKVQGPNGPLYTRSGQFQVDAAGKLVTKEGYPVLGQNGVTLSIRANETAEIGADGTIRQGGNSRGQLQVVNFQQPAALAKQGHTYFRYTGPESGLQEAPAKVLQGHLEASNVGTAESAVRLVSVMRQFEMLQRAVSVTSEMGRKSVEDLARVGS